MNVVRLATAFCLLFAISCTVDNPLYTPGPDAGGPLPGRVDLSGTAPPDLAVGVQVDLAPPSGTCSDRTCSSVGSEACVNGVPVPDRTCPEASSCSNGYCQPPAMSGDLVGRNCDLIAPSETLCLASNNTTTSCQPFVDASDTVLWRCAHAVGAGAVGTMCSQGNQCRSGFCGSNGTCFRPCASLADCPTSGQGKRVCSEVSIVVEGKKVSAKSCIPQ